jgi:alpha-ketoglutarate-dependent taurine dioxygenase
MQSLCTHTLRDGSTRRFGSVIAAQGRRLDDLVAEAVLAELSSGAVLLRDFPSVGSESFAAFTQQLGIRYVPHDFEVAPRQNEDVVARVEQTGILSMPFRTEGSFLPGAADVCCFACIDAVPFDGYTLLCDGVTLLRGVRPETERFLRATRVRYTRRYAPRRWRHLLQTDDRDRAADSLQRMMQREPAGRDFHFWFLGDRLYSFFVAPCIGQSAFSDEEALSSGVLGELQALDLVGRLGLYFSGEAELPDLALGDGSIFPAEVFYELHQLAYEQAYAHRWQNGDILLVDNRRVMVGGCGGLRSQLLSTQGMLR